MLHCVNLLSQSNMDVQQCVNKGLLFCPELQPFKESRVPLVFEEINVLIDMSGSTNNVGGRGRHFARGIQIDDMTQSNVPKTKPIYLAEEEGLAHILVHLSNNFNLEGKSCSIGSFDSSYHTAFSGVLGSSKQLYDFATNLDSKLHKNFGSTNLTEALNNITDMTKDTLLIILSDGRPDCPLSVVERMDYLSNEYKKNNKRLFVFTVGAGSISESKDGRTISFSHRGSRNTGLDNISALKSLGGGAECDKKFLEFISEKGFIGSYCGAYSDYFDLKKAFTQYIDSIHHFSSLPQGKWVTKLDGGAVAELPQYGQQCMERLRVSGRDFGLYHDEQRGYYVYSFGEGMEPYQMHVEPIKGYVSENKYVPDNIMTVCFPENITIDERKYFTLFSSVNGKAMYTNVVFVAVKPDGSTLYFRPDTTHDNYYRVRRLVMT